MVNIFVYSVVIQKLLSARSTRTVNRTGKMERKFPLCWSESTKWCPESTKWCPESTKWCPESPRGLIRINKGGHRISKVCHAFYMYSTVQYSTVRYSTVQYSTVQCSTVQYSTVSKVNNQHYLYISLYTYSLAANIWPHCYSIVNQISVQHSTLVIQYSTALGNFCCNKI